MSAAGPPICICVSDRGNPECPSHGAEVREREESLTSASCYACRIEEKHVTKSAAFVAGIAFALSHNNEAVERFLCAIHFTVLAAGHNAAKGAIAPGDRRAGSKP